MRTVYFVQNSERLPMHQSEGYVGNHTYHD